MVDRTSGRVALLSIHPHHANAILQGEKLVELRRTPVAPDVARILIYATAPVQAVVGWFDVTGVDVDSKTGIWNAHGAVAGVTRREFRDYFAGAVRAYAIRVGNAQRLDPPVAIEQIPGVRRPPQSFQYVDPGPISWLFDRQDDGLIAATAVP